MHHTLSISSPTLDADCANVIELMKKCGFTGRITPNKTILPNGFVENGCEIILAEKCEHAPKVLWKHAQDNFGLTCAHVESRHYVSGCVFDVFRQSICPSD